MILHHFCWRSSKNTLFWPKTLIFDRKSRKYQKKSEKYPKFLGIPRDPCGDPCGDHQQGLLFAVDPPPMLGIASFHQILHGQRNTRWPQAQGQCPTLGIIGQLHRDPQGHRAPQGSSRTPRNPRNPWIFGISFVLFWYFLDFLVKYQGFCSK